MDTSVLIESWSTLGVTGVMALLFGFMIANIIKSQNTQNQTLNELATSQAKAEETIDNLESILLKLLSRMDKSDDRLAIRFDNLVKETNDMDNQLSEIKGVISRLNGNNR